MPAKRLAGLAAVVMMAGLTTGCCAWCQRHCAAPAPAPVAYAPAPAPACCAPAPVCCTPAPTCCAPAAAGYPAPVPQQQWQRTYGTPPCCQ
ncbi:MAG TPA: hypothetical protein VG013_27615 [Gemmataceae bacterium]|nr:hypothetical protein [Gemmataceae bacterium]